MESDSTKKDGILTEFQALRQETITSINARIWGTLTYIAVVGGIGAWYSKAQNANLALLLILTALPLLWHTCLRERSRIRIGSYIKVVLEPKHGLYWEHALEEWRQQTPSTKRFVQIIDKCFHILSLTGIYTIGSLCGLYVVLSHLGFIFQKIIAWIGFVIIIIAHIALYRFYSSSKKYDEIFEIVKDKRDKDINNAQTD